MFEDLARTYSNNHLEMHKPKRCRRYFFPEGITNGADWYVVAGGVQDFNYLWSNCFEITIELSCCKYPKEDKLMGEWQKNEKSLVKYLLKVHQGIKGHVMRKGGQVEGNARVQVKGIDKTVTTTEKGEFWRLLRPGNYSVMVTSSDGRFYSDAIDVIITPEEPLVHLEIELSKES